MPDPSRGEIWTADLDPTRGHEQAGRRPVLIVSDDRLNHGRAGLLFVVPLTTAARPLPSHVEIDPPEAGVTQRSSILCERLRSISRERLVRKWGDVSTSTLAAVEDCLRILLAL